MLVNTARLRNPAAVTFDCWQTLLYEVRPEDGAPVRAARLAARTGIEIRRAAESLAAAWRAHQVAWHRREVLDGRAMTLRALEALGVELDAGALDALVEELEGVVLEREVVALEGARDTLVWLTDRGVRLALVCDTGFSPGRVVRKLLDRVGLLELLEVTVFSDEVGVPKPHPAMFRAALDPLGVDAARAVHVGDLRRSDVAGAHAYGMAAVRISQRHDDADNDAGAKVGVIDCHTAGCAPLCARPEADAVASSHEQLLEILRG